MNKTIVVAIVLSVIGQAQAFDTYSNPDRYPSVGMGISTGKLPGMLTAVPQGAPSTDGGFVKGALDVRVPITNSITVNAFGSSTGINNNLEFSEGHEVGLGLRVYFQDK